MTRGQHVTTALLSILGAASLASTPGLVRAADAAAAVSTASDIDSAATLGELVVTARRESERAIDVPIAMSVLTQDDLAKTGSYTLTDVQNLTPSFTAYQSNARNSSIGIRGIGVSSAADGLDTSVGVYIDNVYLGRPGMALEDLVDIDQFEVLRGPQGTLFGRNSSAGVVIISTEKPSFTLGAVVEASAGDFDYNQERLSVTGPLVDGVLAFRLTAYNTYREGVLPNLTTGIAANGVGRQGARAQLLWTPTPDVSVRFIGDYSREDDTCCVTSLKQVLPATITPATGRDLTVFGELGYTPVATDDYTLNNSPQDMLTDQHSGSVEVDWNLHWAELTSITAYRYWHFDPLQDSDNTPLDILQVNVAQTRDEQYSQEFRLSSKTGRFDWQAGVYLFYQFLRDHYILNQFGRDASAFYTDYTFLQNPANPPVTIAPGSQYIDDVRAITTSVAAFGQVNYEVTDRLTLTAGLRYTHDDKSGVANTSTVGTPYMATSIPFSYDVSVTGDNLSWLASATYKFSPDIVAYASYSTGYKSAGLNLDSAVTAGVPLVLRPEIVGSWEVGLKQSLFDHRVSFDIDGFWTDLSGLQANIYPTDGAKSYLANVGDITARGIEADAAWIVATGLTLSASGSYDDAYYTSYTNAPCPVGGGAVCNLTGQPVYESPKWTANAQLLYSFAFSGTVSPYVLAQYSYRSSAFGTVDDGPLTEIPAYYLVNARIGAAIDDGRYDLSFWVMNALNAQYFQNLGANSLPGAGSWGIGGQLGTPRTYGVTLRARF